MKKSLLVLAGVMMPFGFAMADSAGEAKGEDANKAVNTTGPTFPDWDTRKAGESLDLSGGEAKDESEK